MSMDIQSHKLKQTQNIKLHSPTVCITSCAQYFAAGCLDDTLRIWYATSNNNRQNKFPPVPKQPYILHNQSLTSICDLAFTDSSTHLASLSLDSIIRIFQLDTKSMRTIQVPMFSAWRIIFVGDTLITCGDLGKVYYYDLVSREIIRKSQAGQTGINAVAIDKSNRRIVVGNNNGQAFILGVQKKQDTVTFKPHYKPIRSIFVQNSAFKSYTASDDCSIISTDLKTLKKTQIFQGHSQKVNCIKPHLTSSHIFFSCSSDKTVKIWDTRIKHHVYSHNLPSQLYTLQPVGKSLLIGSQSGIMQVFNIQ